MTRHRRRTYHPSEDKAPLRAYRKAHGLCWECGSAAVRLLHKGNRRLSRCAYHREDARKRSEERRREEKTPGRGAKKKRTR